MEEGIGKMGYVTADGKKFDNLREDIKHSGHKMTLERALNIVGYFSVRKNAGEVILKVGGVTSRHKSAKEAFQILEELVERTEKVSTEQNPPEWYRILFNAGFSSIRAIRVYDFSQTLSINSTIHSYMDYIDWISKNCHGIKDGLKNFGKLDS